ncbi:ABC transporter substrate-binding protein [Paenibacillus xylanilyticus]|uniref:ABC transporter substrate-binding protein n=1 Tax=Paenibacillus xylanilyticus TaxID=248903 RepID=UPI00399F4437
MYKTSKSGLLVLVLMLVVAMLAACSTKTEPSAEPAAASAGGTAEQPLTKVKIQLKWVPQAQFAGIYAAKEQGFFADEGIDAEIIPGGPDIVIEQQVVNGAADVGITGVDSLLVSRDNGLPLVSLAQISQKSSYRLIAKKSAGITDPAQMKGKKVSTWFGSQQFQVLAFMEKNGLDPKKDIELVKQGFTMDQFFNDQVDVATATIYNEYHVVLESGVQESDLDVFNIEDAGVGMLEDTLIAKKDWVDSNRDLAVKVTRAILKGWNYAIDNQEETVDTVMSNVTDGSTTREHQVTMLAEIAKLIRPEGFTEQQVGSFVDESFARTAEIALNYGLIKKAANLDEALEKSIYEDAVK